MSTPRVRLVRTRRVRCANRPSKASGMGQHRRLATKLSKPNAADRRSRRSSPLTPSKLRVRLIMFSGADHALASLRESNLTLAIISHASALAIVASKSFARRRLRFEPCDGSFDNPATWQQFEALGG